MQRLVNKIRIVAGSRDCLNVSRKRAEYYSKYNGLVFKALKEPPFQAFLGKVAEKEDIEEDRVKDIQVKAFPIVKKNGNGVAGKCNRKKGIIRIYPRRRKVCLRLKERWGKGKFETYIRLRAQAALLHELLHMKYSGKEQKVRLLTKKYLSIFIQRTSLSSNVDNILKRLFTNSPNDYGIRGLSGASQ